MGTNLIKAERTRRVRKISGRVDVAGGTPSVGAGSGFTVTDGGAGVVGVVFTKPGKSLLSFIAIPIEATAATGHFCKVQAQAYTGVTVGIYVADATDGAPVDNVGFFFEATLKDVSN
jgi:hypothetical protein